MNILITGGTGFIGTPLVARLAQEGHQMTILTRQEKPTSPFQAVSFCQNLAHFQDLNDFDAVINLAGEPIFDKRWTEKQKRILQESRLSITRQLVELIEKSSNPPHTFLSGSATGYYGDLPYNQAQYDELTPAGKQFTSLLCQNWENEALKVVHKTRVCLLRTGMVLSAQGGALKRMLPLFEKRLAGKLGNGKQHWAWISLEDYLNAVLFLLKNDHCQGAYNLVVPYPVTNAFFTQWLAETLHPMHFATSKMLAKRALAQRIANIATPVCVLKSVLGERATLLLDNQPLIPKRLLESGFQFRHPHLQGMDISS